jgi:hypothetical protein
MSFDPSQFINTTVQGPMSTAYVVCPEGEWRAVVSDDGEINSWFREVKWNDKQTGQEKTAVGVKIPFRIIDEKARQIAKRGPEEKLYAFLDAFLDIDAQGGLDLSEGKNVKLGQLRNALGQNAAGQAWSFGMLRGAGPLVVKVKQDSFDKSDPSRKSATVVGFAKLV